MQHANEELRAELRQKSEGEAKLVEMYLWPEPHTVHTDPSALRAQCTTQTAQTTVRRLQKSQQAS